MPGRLGFSKFSESEHEDKTFLGRPNWEDGKIFKFVRRPDLDMWTRLELALRMNPRNFNAWGMVSQLAFDHGVSRQFLYDNHALFTQRILSWNGVEPKMAFDDEFVHRLMLCARLFCSASIDGIVETLNELGFSPGSAGHVSEFLKEIGKACSIEIPDTAEPVALMLDETFTQNQPILVIMEASSHYVLSILLAPDRKSSTWVSELNRLNEAGIKIKYLVKDQGASLKTAAEMLNLPERADLFHLMRHFDPFLASMERHAYGAIEEETQRERIFDNRKTEGALNKAISKYDKAVAAMQTAIKNFDDYDYLHKCLHESFDSFAPDGSVRGKEIVAGDVEAALSLLNELFGTHEKICAAVKFLRNNLDDYWGYVEQLKDIVQKYAQVIPEHTLRFVCLSWQLAKKAMAVKNSALKRKLYEKSADYMNLVLNGADNTLKVSIAKLKVELDENIRSSSPLEAINSVIRRYLQSCRGQVTPESLNLIAFHINNKIATRGKYAGTSAFMRLTGKTHDESVIRRLAKLSPRLKKRNVESAQAVA